MNRQRARGGAPTASLLVLLLVLSGCGVLTTSSPSGAPYEVRMTYRVLAAPDATPTADDVEAVRSIIESRLLDTGLAALRVTARAPDLVIVETAPASVVDDLRPLAGATGRVDFVPLGDAPVAEGQRLDLEQFPPLFSGDQVASASIGADQTGNRAVDLVLRPGARRLFGDYTSANVGSYFAIVVDGVAVSVPVINGPIPGGEVQISAGSIDGLQLVEAQRLVTLLRYGPLPFRLEEVALERL